MTRHIQTSLKNLKQASARILCLISSVLLLNACQTTSTDHTPQTSTPAEVRPQPSIGPVTINANCENKEDDGYYDKISMVVDNNVVKSMDWTARPRAGTCRFELKNFTQVASQPQADLQSKKDKKCHVYVWQDADHITAAVYGCKKICKVNDKILPVLIEPRTGGCKARPH